MTIIDHSITDHQGLVGETNLASGIVAGDATIASQLNTGVALPIGSLTNVSVGLIQKWTTDSTIAVLNAATSTRITLTWNAPFPNTIFLVMSTIIEGTVDVALTSKIVSYTLSGAVVEVANLDAVAGAGPITIKILGFGN